MPEKASPSRQRPPAGPTKRRTSRSGPSKRLVLSLAILLVAAGYCLGGFWALPQYLRYRLPPLVKEQTGWQLHLGSVTFNPFTFRLHIGDITLDDQADSTQHLLKLDDLLIHIAPLPLLRGEITSTRLVVDTFQINLVRNDVGSYNFFRLSQNGDNHGIPRPFDLKSLPFRFSLRNISLLDGRLTFHDKPNNVTHQIEQIAASLPNFSNFSGQTSETIHPSFSAIVNGSPVQLTGQTSLTGASNAGQGEVTTRLSLDFDAIDLNRYFDYFPFALPFTIEKGKAEGTLQLTFVQTRSEILPTFGLSMRSVDAALSAGEGSFQLLAPAVKLEGSLEPLSGVAHLTNLELREPEATIASSFSFTDYQSLINLRGMASDGKTGSEVQPQITIDHLMVDNGTAILSGTTDEQASSRWQMLQINLKNYTNRTQGNAEATPPATFRISGEQSTTRATFSLQGKLDEHLLPAGDLLLSKVDAGVLFPFIGLDDTAVQDGTVDAQATISFKDYPNLDLLGRITIEKGFFTFNELALSTNKHIWFSAPSVKFTDFSKEGAKLSLGNVFLRNSVLNLDTGTLPGIAKKIGEEKGNVSIEAVDFSGKLTLSNKARKLPELDFTEVSLQAINLARLESSSEGDNLIFTARLGKRGEIQAKGKVRLNAFITTLTTGFTGIDGARLLPWFTQNHLIDDATLTLAGKGVFSFPFTSYKGMLLLQNGELTKAKGDNQPSYFSWQEINLQNFSYTGNPLHLGASQCIIANPRFSWSIDKNSPFMASSLGGFLLSFLPGSATSESSKQPPLDLRQITISGGTVAYRDNRPPVTWSTEIAELAGTIENLSSDPSANPSPFSFNGIFDNAEFSLTGSADLLHPNRQGSAELTVAGLELSPVQKELNKQLAIDASQGTLSTRDRFAWGNGMVTRHSLLTLSGVRALEEKSDTALALALLLGENDRLSLTVDSDGSMAGGQPPLVTEGVATVKKLVAKAAVSPLLLVSDNYKDLAGQEFVLFEPGKMLLTPAGQEVLNRFASLLKAYPDIRLVITGSADRTIDGKAMQQDLERVEDERVQAENSRRKIALKKAVDDFLAQAAQQRQTSGSDGKVVEQQIPKSIYRQFAPITPAEVQVDTTMLLTLASQRAQAVADLLHNGLGLPGERIDVSSKEIVNEKAEVPGNTAVFSFEPLTRTKEKLQ
ncbi:MAG: DUF748 domain-containing protein [Desulfopila sp.]